MFQPVADFFNENSGFGLTLMTIMQVLCDLQIIGMVFYWMNYGNSFVYPISVAFLGLSKILINVTFNSNHRFFLKLAQYKMPSVTDYSHLYFLEIISKIPTFLVELQL